MKKSPDNLDTEEAGDEERSNATKVIPIDRRVSELSALVLLDFDLFGLVFHFRCGVTVSRFNDYLILTWVRISNEGFIGSQILNISACGLKLREGSLFRDLSIATQRYDEVCRLKEFDLTKALARLWCS